MIKFRKYYAFFLVLLMVLSLNLVFVIPKVKASEPEAYPGVCGTPPIIYNRTGKTNWGYAVTSHSIVVPPSTTTLTANTGIHTVTPFDYEINMPGPEDDTANTLSVNSYVKSNNLVMDEIMAYRPVFFLDAASWYDHKLTLQASSSSSFTAEFNLGISTLQGSCSIYGGISQTTSTTVGGGWTEQTHNGNWCDVYVMMTFLRIHGSLTFFDGSVRNYDAVIMEYVDFINHVVTRPELGYYREYPLSSGTTLYDPNGDGTPEPFYHPNFNVFYNNVKSSTSYFGVDLDYNNIYFGMSGGAKFTWGSSSSITLQHTFTGTSMPSKYDHFNLAINNYFDVNIDPVLKSSSGGGSGCPYLSVYDGSKYVNEGLLNIHDLNGIEITTNHTLITKPEPVNGQYLLKLTEYPKTISYIDHVQLQGRLGNNGTLVP
ncbi:MAG: hypothetical protein P8Y97_21675, partial [Candidatus Lokiarchaeota archaeon]